MRRITRGSAAILLPAAVGPAGLAYYLTVIGKITIGTALPPPAGARRYGAVVCSSRLAFPAMRRAAGRAAANVGVFRYRAGLKGR
jgi:hypothetical protein